MDWFTDARQLDMITSDLVFADWRRGLNRALIASLANGDPPFTKQEEESAKINTNVNDLKHCGILHDARSQFANGFLQQGQYYTAVTDRGAKHKRSIYSAIVEKEFNRPLLESIEYFETKRSQFALLVLHGIGPSVWETSYSVLPEAISVADALVPTNTKVGFKNLPILTFRKSLTGMELEKLTLSAKRDPGWNMGYVKRCMKWVDQQMQGGLGGEYNDNYRPEKWEDELKQQAGWYMSDRVPTIDVFDCYCYVEGSSKQGAGWVRRMILDSWSGSGQAGPGMAEPAKRSDMDGLHKTTKDDFLYTSGKEPVADSWQNIACFQYADLTANAPFLHNAVRSLGWMTYAQCHIGNRLKCRFYDSVFEALLQYFQVSTMDEVQRAMKLELANMGFIDDTIKPVKAADRWQPNSQLIELGLQMNEQDIENNSKAWTQNAVGGSNTEKTKFQYMAELQKMSMLVGAGLNQAHRYAKFEGKEIFRRLCMKNSKDPLSRTFRVNCMRQGVPEELLVPEAWTIDSEKMMGQGNQTLALMVAQELLQLAPGLDPEPQRIVKRNFVMELTHNPTMALELVPEKPSEGKVGLQEASRVSSALMQAIPADMIGGTNPIEYIQGMLKILALKVQAGLKSPQKMIPAQQLQGLGAIAQNAGGHIKLLEQDPAQKQFVKKAGDVLGKLENELKGFGQRLQAAMKKQAMAAQKQNGHGGEDAAKAASIAAVSKAKIDSKNKETTAKIMRDNIKFMQETKHKKLRTQADIAAKDLTTAAEINRGGMTSFNEGEE